ncbi:transglutaminase-like domain-containing protein [Spirosoma sp.]|uniref:transglutaminase-like domain-containing protein n=1 Tax=Spirosoma sp. TaxID=1899569 RepID=UPI002605E344|nr:transglutaminase-like domain-containing protein [Spirosoma sp.]MCX6218612.1 transglutaminase-like domain-containing protein [Spirosoma sp.]
MRSTTDLIRRGWQRPLSLLWQAMGGLLVLALMAASTAPPRTRTVHFSYKAVIGELPAGTRQVDIWIPVPHSSAFQQISDLTVASPYPYQFDTAQYGNRMMHLHLQKPPGKEFAVEMQFTATRREHIQPQQPTGNAEAKRPIDPYMKRWLQPDRLVPIDGSIKRWARAVVDSAGAKTDLQRARAVYNHVIATVKYDKTGTGWGRGDIYYACDTRRGNCTDFHAIFIGYCRALGIPARFAIGFSLPTDRPAGQVSGYHCWAEFYSKDLGWVPIDASEAAKNPARRAYFFGAHDENRIEFSLGRDLILYPGQVQPLNYFIYPLVVADGQSLTPVMPAITYRNAGR